MIYICDLNRHLICDPYSIENLHRMAKELNIKKCWFHYKKNFAHYDIPKTRVQEISARCKIVSSKEIIEIIKRNEMTPPRDVIAWDAYYMGMVYMNPVRSKDPSTQVGAFIVNKDHEPLGMGYNGAPQAIPDNKINWARPDKYKYVVHAEKNAIRYAVAARGKDALVGSTMYVSAMPCTACMLDIVTYRIGKVVYGLTAAKMLTPEMISESIDMATLGGVEVEKYITNLSWLRDRLDWLENNVPEMFVKS